MMMNARKKITGIIKDIFFFFILQKYETKMSTSKKLLEDIFNLSTTTATFTHGYDSTSTQTTDNHQLETILSYTIPLSCFTVILVISIVIGIRKRYRILDKWISLSQMRNTNPKFQQDSGLRRNSEFESYNHADAKSVSISEENPLYTKRERRLATIA